MRFLVNQPEKLRTPTDTRFQDSLLHLHLKNKTTAMKLTTTLAAIGIALLMTTAAFAQKIKWEKGDDLAFMKGQRDVAAEFDYSKITVKGEAPATYLESQKTDLNADKPGDGDAFVAEWTDAREKKYQPEFAKGFNKMLLKDSIWVNNSGNAKYTIILTTEDMSLGKGKMFVKKPAEVTFSFVIVETANKDNVVAKGRLEEVDGQVDAPKGSAWMGGVGTVMQVSASVKNRDYSNRIANAYNNAGLAIGKAIHRAL